MFLSKKTSIPSGTSSDTTASAPAVTTAVTPHFHYIEIQYGCNYAFEGECVNLRSGPGTHYKSVLKLRPGIVLKVEEKTVPGDGHDWYKVIFDAEVRYPERVTSDWYIAVNPDAIRAFDDVGDVNSTPGIKTDTKKRIVVDLSKETLDAYDGNKLFMHESISRGVDADPTPIGTFSIYRKTPSRYMQGPLPGVSDEAYDLPGVPWDLYFTADGAVLHGAYWHNNFGKPMSHGCINQTPANAKKLYLWADIGTTVTVVE